MRRRIAAIAGAALAVALLAGCTDTAPGPSDGTTAWTEYQHPTTPVVSFSGPLLGDGTFSTAQHRGEVLVVNFWYAGCGPCNAEAPSLDALAKKFAGQKVQFVGVDVRDTEGTAQPFVTQHRVPYPIVLDQKNRAAVQLAFSASSVPTTTFPTTAIVGTKGRVTAIYSGQIDAGIMTTLIQAAVSGRDA